MLLGNQFIFLFSCIGFFISIMFPTMMSIIIKEFPSGTSSIMGFIIAVNGGTNIIFNWVMGKTNDMLNVNFGFMSIVFCMVLIIAFIVPLSRILTFDKSANQAA